MLRCAASSRLNNASGLFDDPYRYSNEARQPANTLTPQHRALAREAAQKSIVLLKNNDALLPLSKHLRNVLVVGSLATDAEASDRPWALAADPEDSITVLQGIRPCPSPDTEVVYLGGASPISNAVDDLAEVLQAARDAEVVIAVLGERADQSGEARSRTELGLPGCPGHVVACPVGHRQARGHRADEWPPARVLEDRARGAGTFGNLVPGQ